MVVQLYTQKIQVHSQNLTLKQSIAYVGVNVPLHITYVTDIEYLTNTSKDSESNITHPPTYEHPHRHFYLKRKEISIWSHTRNILCHFFEFRFQIIN